MSPSSSTPATASSPSFRPLTPIKTLLSDLKRILQTHKPELLSSAAARGITILLLNPLDATKARLQASQATSKLALRAATQGSPFAGLVPALLAHAPGGVLAFLLYSRLHTSLARSDRSPAWLPTPIAAACLADVFAAFWLAPWEAAKLRVQTFAFPHALSAFRAGAVWNGLFAQIARDVPCRVLHLVLYEKARDIHEKRTGKVIDPGSGAVTGALVGALVGILTTPLDVIKTRVMAQRAPPGRAYQGWFACARKTVQTEGRGALFRGVGQRAVYMALSVALFSAAYEVSRKAYKDKIESVIGRRSFPPPAFLHHPDHVFVDAKKQ